MFETALAEKLKKILDLKKVTFNVPSDETPEQEYAFIEVEKARCKVVDKKEIAQVTGKIKVFVNQEKMPFDFYAKKISEADPDDKRDFYFFDIGVSEGRYMNLDVRSISFVFFFTSQYDPNQGLITSIDITGTVGD